jgi:hypothetical protein
MRERCRDPENTSYGARGINICERWDSYLQFLSDMGARPEDMTLDRIDVNKGYAPDNCKWSTATQQQRNKRRARYLLIDGRKISLMDVADRLGIKKNAAQSFFSVALRLKEHYGRIPDIENSSSLAGNSVSGADGGRSSLGDL